MRGEAYFSVSTWGAYKYSASFRSQSQEKDADMPEFSEVNRSCFSSARRQQAGHDSGPVGAALSVDGR